MLHYFPSHSKGVFTRITYFLHGFWLISQNMRWATHKCKLKSGLIKMLLLNYNCFHSTKHEFYLFIFSICARHWRDILNS